MLLRAGSCRWYLKLRCHKVLNENLSMEESSFLFMEKRLFLSMEEDRLMKSG